MAEKGSEIEVTILFFAYLRDAVGSSSVSLKLSAKTTVADLKTQLIKKYPALKERLSHTIAAINRQFVEDSITIPPNAEIAFFPPVSGGELPTITRISETRIDLNEITSKISGKQIGGICIFLGVVRGSDPLKREHETRSLEYQAYVPMAEEKIKQIVEEIRVKWPEIYGVAIVQQLGVFLPGEISTIIACSSSHRDQGIFEACRFAIDRLKQIVPVWKKETGSDGVTWIEGEYIPGRGD